MRSFLMCPPTYFAIDYEINPWMHTAEAVDRKQAQTQWDQLKQTYQELGCRVETIEPVEGWPDMVFTANAGLVIDEGKFLLSSFKYPERQGEEPFFREWFEDADWQIDQLSTPYEGQGESFLWNDKLLAGFGFRSNEHTIDSLKEVVGTEVVPLQLKDPRYYHLDMALAPISQELIAYNPAAFTDEAVSRIKALEVELIEITEADADAFAANLVTIDKTVVMAKGATQLPQQLKKHGYKVVELEMGEFRKSGGGVRCLTLDL